MGFDEITPRKSRPMDEPELTRAIEVLPTLVDAAKLAIDMLNLGEMEHAQRERIMQDPQIRAILEALRHIEGAVDD